MQKYRSSKRGLTFSLDPEEKYYPGSHYIYEVRKNCIIIRPSDNGMTVSRKKSGNNIRALFDIRRKEVRNAVAHCSYLEMEIKKDRIVIRCIQETRNKIVSMEEVLKEFSISNTVLKLASGLEGQISLAEYFGTIGGFETYEQLPAARKKDIKKVFTVMSLFSGAGMLDWPFYKDNCFKLDFACDYDKGACESYRENIGDHILCGDVRNVSGYKDPYNLIIGGPSCKPFSSSNRRKRLAEHEDVDLVNEYIRITKENKPEIFVIENVPQFLTCQDGIHLACVMDKLGAEYEITSSIIKDCDVGGYTLRKRAVLIGSRIGKVILPALKLRPLKTVREALAKVTSDWFNFYDQTRSKPETVSQMALVRPGHNYKDIPALRNKPDMHSDRYYRLDPDKPAPTIVNWRKLPLIHPAENRTLTVAEASALMGFGKDFHFCGTISERQQQCGNGCTYAIGKLIKETVKNVLIQYHAKLA